MATDPRWSDEAAELVAQSLAGSPLRASDVKEALPYAQGVLATLANAGLLVPPGSEVIEEWAYPVVTKPGHTRWVHTWLREAVIPGMAKRSVITGPWVEAPAPTKAGSPS